MVFGKYTLLHRIARGGMAELFLARAVEPAGFERICVIKLVSSLYAKDRAFTTMFEDEMRIAARLQHPNIGMVLDAGCHEGRYYMAMEFIHGHDLRTIIRRSRESTGQALSVTATLRIAVCICSALQYAHDAQAADGTPLGLIHRDVSPSNIMVSYDGQVKLIDFGIAKAVGRSTLTVPGTIKGKVQYLSPEQILNKTLDRRSDLFTLGATLWEALAGRQLFAGEHPGSVYRAITMGTIPSPSSVAPSIPPEFDRIILKALAQDVAQRYGQARELQLDLERFAVRAGISLSDLALAQEMCRLFATEVQQWRRAQSEGIGLLAHLQAVEAAKGDLLAGGAVLAAGDLFSSDSGFASDDLQDPADEAVTNPDPTRPDGLPACDFATTQTGPEPEAGRKTRFMGSDFAHATSVEGPRKTILYGAEVPAFSASVSSTSPERIGPPAGDAPSAQGQADASSDRAASSSDPNALFGAPPVQAQAPVTDSLPLKRARTGDWAHQATAQGEPRGTVHPYFKALAQTPQQAGVKEAVPGEAVSREAVPGEAVPGEAVSREAVSREAVSHDGLPEETVSFRSRWPWLILGAAIVSVALAIVLVRSFTRSAGMTSAMPVPSRAQAPSVQLRSLRLITEPPGATASDVESGEVLGKTPTLLRVPAKAFRRLALRLPGYTSRVVHVRPGEDLEPITLQPLQASPSPPPLSSPSPRLKSAREHEPATRSKRHPGAAKRKRVFRDPSLPGTELRNPFGD